MKARNIPADECAAYIHNGWSPRACRRKLKPGEQTQEQLCGIHLAAQRKRKANDAERKAKATARAEQDTLDEANAEKLLTTYALRIWPYGKRGEMLVAYEDLERVLSTERRFRIDAINRAHRLQKALDQIRAMVVDGHVDGEGYELQALVDTVRRRITED